MNAPIESDEDRWAGKVDLKGRTASADYRFEKNSWEVRLSGFHQGEEVQSICYVDRREEALDLMRRFVRTTNTGTNPAPLSRRETNHPIRIKQREVGA